MSDSNDSEDDYDADHGPHHGEGSEKSADDDDRSWPTGDDDGEAEQVIHLLDGERIVGANAQEVNDQSFEELVFPPRLAEEVKEQWAAFIRLAESREAAGESIYAAVFDAAPSLQSLFKTPRAVMAMRFMNGLNQIIQTLHDPPALKILVETLAFQHLDLEVTPPRVVIFREAIVELVASELGDNFTDRAHHCWNTVLNYVGGAYIYVRVKYSDRIRILASSWATANNRRNEEHEAELGEEGALSGEKDGEELQQNPAKSGEVQSRVSSLQGAKDAHKSQKKRPGAGQHKSFLSRLRGIGNSQEARLLAGGSEQGSGEMGDGAGFRNTSVPTTYNEMFAFNAAVMGFGGHGWMMEVLASFDTIVRNVSNTYRLQEECDILSLRISKYKGHINLADYKAVMLASLRSLVPKDWNSAHEVAWSWLWENVERMLKSLMGMPTGQEKALERLWGGLDEQMQMRVRQEVYAKFFVLAPAGQDYFKQSTTRLHFIADRIMAMTLEIFKDPKKMVEDISALGLRHVGYGIPTELFGPFVTAAVQVVRGLTEDDAAEEAFRWSLSLISRILIRVINEGSTIVMKSINQNSAKQLRKAVACAPRSKRAQWVLNIQVGTQSISPLLWSIKAGSLEAGKAILVDLLTIRADRDRYYFGMDDLFERHPDIIKRLCMEAPVLLPVLLDGLIWRSRVTENGIRRVNYYIKHLVVDSESNFSKATEWLVQNGDPKLICHPVVVLVCDTVWSSIACRSFLVGKLWFLLTLIVFVASQAVLNRVQVGDDDLAVRAAVFSCRCFIYVASMGHWIYFHVKSTCSDVKNSRTVRIVCIPVPAYLTNWQDVASLVLAMFLLLMFAIEPLFFCFSSKEAEGELFIVDCDNSKDLQFTYSVCSACALFLYFLLLMDLSVFSTRVSAFMLVCTRVLSEVGLFLMALLFVILAFSTAASALKQDVEEFSSISEAALSLLKISITMFDLSKYEALEETPSLLALVIGYVIVTVVFLLNLLIAQLHSAYASTYADMLGFARLSRGEVVVDSMDSVSRRKWDWFVASLNLEDRCEFGEGDLGLAGGIQVFEPAAANPTTVDTIRRFGGSTSPAAQWPADNMAHEEMDRFDRLEKLVQKAMKKMGKGRKRKGGASTEGSSFRRSSTGNSSSGATSETNSDSTSSHR